MGGIVLFDQRIRGPQTNGSTSSDAEPGYSVRVVERDRSIHVEIEPVSGQGEASYIAEFSPMEAYAFLEGFCATMRRVGLHPTF